MSWILSNGGRAPGRVWELEAATLLDYRGGRVGEWAQGMDRCHLISRDIDRCRLLSRYIKHISL